MQCWTKLCKKLTALIRKLVQVCIWKWCVVKASVYFGSVYVKCGRATGCVARRGGTTSPSQRLSNRRSVARGRWRNARPLCPAPRTPAECPRSRPRLHRAAVRARVITNVKCYRTQPSAAPSALRCAALHNNKTWYLKRNVLLTPCSCADANLR